MWESTVGVPAAAQRRKQEAARAQLLYLSALVIAMVGLSYAAVPLYRMFCQATGFGGTTQRKEVSPQCPNDVLQAYPVLLQVYHRGTPYC